MRNESYGLGRYHGVHPKNYISGSGVWQGGRSPSPMGMAQCETQRPRITVLTVSRGSSSPLVLRERVELKDGWPTVKVPYIMVWGYKCSFLSFFIL